MALKELEARYAAKRSRDYKLSDGEGLHLLVRPNGSKLWRLKYRYDGKEKLLSFGRYPDVSLAQVRLLRAEAKPALAEGRDPGAKADQPAAMSFEAVAREWYANRLPALDPGHAARLLTGLERDAFPILGTKNVRAVTSGDVLAMVRAVEARGALDVSRRLKQHVSQIYRFAMPHGWADQDPAAPLFTMLTWARTNETRNACWGEFEGLDGSEPLWRVPADRMKMEREHLVPLSAQAVALLKALRALRQDGFVFPGDKPGKPISQNTMIFGCYRMGYRGRQTVHGFRGLASTWANEAECYRADWIEMALAHVERDAVRGAYNSALYLTPRRRMLQDWADAVEGMIAGRAATRVGEGPGRAERDIAIEHAALEPVL